MAQQIIKNFKKDQGKNAKVSVHYLLSKLAKKFEVSEQAMEIRLKHMGMIQ